jgi:hypothetical protein
VQAEFPRHRLRLPEVFKQAESRIVNGVHRRQTQGGNTVYIWCGFRGNNRLCAMIPGAAVYFHSRGGNDDMPHENEENIPIQ